MQTFTKLTFLLLIINAIALKIYESNAVSKGEKIITGLHYKRRGNENPVLTNSLTTCVRLNLKRLGNFNNPEYGDSFAPLIVIPSSKELYFLAILAGYPNSKMFLGYHNNGKHSYISSSLRDPLSDSNIIWKLFTWHHICFSYSKQNSKIIFVMVSM